MWRTPVPVPNPPGLRTTVVVDYQNVHLVGWTAFPAYHYRPKHEALIHPGLLADRIVAVRNQAHPSVQNLGHRKARVDRVLVYRGLPSNERDPEDYARNLAQMSEWTRDRRVQVTHRGLKYDLQLDATRRPIRDVHGKEIVLGKREKGIDVLCALAVVREAARPDVDLVILASSDTDLVPALEEARELPAQIETFRWDSPTIFIPQLRPKGGSCWCTRLGEEDFVACLDPNEY